MGVFGWKFAIADGTIIFGWKNLSNHSAFSNSPLKTNMDAQNDALESR